VQVEVSAAVTVPTLLTCGTGGLAAATTGITEIAWGHALEDATTGNQVIRAWFNPSNLEQSA